MVYIAERRDNFRKQAVTPVKVYCNLPQAELFVNGKSFGKRAPNALKMAVWENVRLKVGENNLEVKAKSGRKTMEDSCMWELVNNKLCL